MPLPLPLEGEDELAIGHIGRLRRWCGARTRDELVKALRERVGDRGNDGMPALHVVATACGLQPDQYVGRHSMLPFTCFLVSEIPSLGRSAPRWSNTVVNAIGYLTPTGRPTFCGSCAVEQRERRTYSTWNRALQLPGKLRCPRHGAPLLQALEAESFMEQPSDVFASSRYVELPARTWADDDPAVVNFAACTQGMLATCRSWPAVPVRARLSHRAELLGLRTSRAGSLPLLSDLAFDKFPSAFLEELFPLSSGKVSGVTVPTIDYAASNRGNAPTGVAIALAMSILYPSSQEALDDLIARASPTNR